MMRHPTRAVLLTLAGLPTACGVPDVTDLRLDGLSPPHIVSMAPHYRESESRDMVPAIVAELSTARDLRDLANNHTYGTYIDIVLCRGRSNVTRQEGRFDVVGGGALRDAHGVVYDPLPSAAWYPPPSADWPSPIDGRYRYSVAIVLRQQRRVTDPGRSIERSYAGLDLIRDPVDLCLWIDTGNYGPRWRSNTVVIPAAAIRTAVAAAPPR